MAVEVKSEFASYCINLAENPITEPQIEIVSKGNAAILNYYDQLKEQGTDHLYEAKMLIVGEGSAGKTTLSHKISNPNCALPHEDDRTRGISINPFTFDCRSKEISTPQQRDFQLNIWDFGGQEIYHYTHRFFLSKRSLYVLVADNRGDNTDFNYWLNIIELFAEDSPIIIVLNEKDDLQRKVNKTDLRSRYANSIKEILSVNFKTKEETDSDKATARLKQINTLIGHIQHCAQNLPHIGEPVPALWVNVRQAIEDSVEAGCNYIYREQFDDVCKEQNITDPQDIQTLLSYFHDLGVLLFFDKAFLRDRVILNPAWATNAVYRIFDNDHIKALAGRFTRQNCANIWQEPEYQYMHDVLIELMKNFRLIYEVEESGNPKSGNLVAPQLLPTETPTYIWNAAQTNHMQFRYDNFMPKGIFWQLAVILYRYITNQNLIWRNGMVIQRGSTQAEVIEDLQKRHILLRFSGPSIPELRAIVVDTLDGISQTFHRLSYEKMIPCQCAQCIGSNNPHFFKFSRLKQRQESGKKNTIECEISEIDVPLADLLFGYETQAILRTLPDTQGGDPTPPANLPPTPLPTKKLKPSSIFISYRRDDSLNETIRIYERLEKEFGSDAIFRDINSIQLGKNFRKVILQAVKDCQVLLVVMGKDWATLTEQDGTLRIDNPADYVRREISLALDFDKHVIPILLEGSAPIDKVYLPDLLQDLRENQGIQVGQDRHFHIDIDELIDQLSSILNFEA